MPSTPKMKYPYPLAQSKNWYDLWVNGFMAAIDAANYACREDRNTLLQGGGTMSFTASSGVLSWTNPLVLFSMQNAWAWYMLVPAMPFVLNDGQLLYVVVPRGIEQSMTVQPYVGAPGALPPAANDTALVICERAGNRLYFRNGQVLIDGDSFPLIENGGRTGATVGGSLLPTLGLGTSSLPG